jgi:hypothetical protein
MVSRIDQQQMVRLKCKSGPVEAAGTGEAVKAKQRQKKWLSVRNERLWTRIF